MTVKRRLWLILTAITSLLVAAGWIIRHYTPYQPDFWVTGYLPAYRHNGREIPFLAPADYQMLTHLAHVSVIPRADGSLDNERNSLSTENRLAAQQTANQQHLPLLIVVTGSYEQFQPVLQDTVRPQFIAHLLQLLDTGYDGIDIDMEPITRDDKQANPDFTAFIIELHRALQTRHNTKLHRSPLLTTAITLRDRFIVAPLADYFDQINLMAYDMAQPYAGWISWFDSALYNGGLRFPNYSHEVPSVDLWVQRLLAAGIPRHKLGLGISLDVACWYGGTGTTTDGISAPAQAWVTQPDYRKLSYAEWNVSDIFSQQIQWDNTTQMAWFGQDNLGSNQDFFCNFNDERAIQAKLTYAREQGLGGIMIWELGLDHLAQLPANALANHHRPLRHAISRALEK